MDGNSIGFDKHIVILTPGFPESEADNNCIPALQGYVKELAANIGAEKITVLSFQYPFINHYYYWNDVTVFSAGGKNRRGIHRIMTAFRIINEFKKLNRTKKKIAVHSFWLTMPAIVGQILSQVYKVKHISSIMGQDALRSNFYLKFISKQTTVIANSNFVSEVYSTNKQEKTATVIPLGIQPLDYDLNFKAEESFDIICCGSLTQLKQYHLLPELTLKLKSELPNIKIGIIGDGPERERLTKLIAENNLSSNINLLGAIDHRLVLGYLKSAKIFLHLSKYEASSHALLEAHYVGIPTVSFKVGMYETEGLTYQCTTLEEMTKVLYQLLRNTTSAKHNSIPLMKETVARYMKYYEGE
jgi:glycosyltransferase involved in cell wall biosynthesis